MTRKRKREEELHSIKFHNKGLDFIKLQSILRDADVQNSFQLERGDVETPTVVYRLNPSIRSKLFNYKETVDSINADDRETFGTGIERCQCSDSTFCDPTHGHFFW